MSTQRRRRVSAVSFALLVALVAGCGSGSEAESTPPADEDSTASAGPDTTPSAEEPTGDGGATDGAGSGGDVPADWQMVDVGDATFMVPPEWEIERYDVDGVQRERALYGSGYCPDEPAMVTGLAFTGWVEGQADAAAALTGEADRMASAAFEGRSPQVELSEFQENGTWVATVAAVTMEPSDDPCDPVEAVFVLRGAPYENGSGTYVFTVVGELGHEQSPAVEDLVMISNSFANG